jgi:hypothetical protein
MLTHRIVAYLIGLAVGYWVLTLAEKEKNFNKTLGKIIGGIIIVVSLIGPLCIAGKCMMGKCEMGSGCCSSMSSCPMEKGGAPMAMPGMTDDQKKAK